MASESKIGLLLGLGIIFVVAFVINGLPRFGNASQSDDLTNIVDNSPAGIAPRVPEQAFYPGNTPQTGQEATSPQTPDQELHRQPLPGTAPPSELPTDPGTVTAGRTNNGTPQVVQFEQKQPAWPKIHIVRKGENLADIAKIYYGPKEGNRRANVMRIYKSNRNVLDSPDMIFPGQKLVIPSLWASDTNRKTMEDIFPDSMFERVPSVGRRHM